MSYDTTGVISGLVGDATIIKAIFVPIGGIIAWAKTLAGVPSLPDSYLECNGAVISDADSPLNGETLPDLNSTQRFLRGAASSGATGGTDSTGTHTHSQASAKTIDDGAGGSAHLASAILGSAGAHNNLPSYYEVVYVMRIK